MIHQAPSLLGAPASQDAMNAVRAAKSRNKWGAYSTNQFVKNRGIKDMFLIASINEIEMDIRKQLVPSGT